MSICYLDIETTLDHSTIWCAVTKVKNNIQVHTTASTLQRTLYEAEKVVGHNLIGFDVGVLHRVWDVNIPRDRVVDSLYLSRLYNPSQELSLIHI